VPAPAEALWEGKLCPPGTAGRAARRAALQGATVVLSNHDLPVVRHQLYQETLGFRHVARPRVARAISRGARGSVDEVIARIGPLRRTGIRAAG